MLIGEVRNNYRKLNIPLVAYIELTGRCNLRCIHCYFKPFNSKDELTLSEIKNIVDQLQNIGTLVIGFSGGEIFVRNDWPMS